MPEVEIAHTLTDAEKALRERLSTEDWFIVKAGFRRSYDSGRDDEQDRMITKGYRDTSEDFCCVLGCGSGACESCPCCCAGWCVMGRDGIPEDDENRAIWIEVAAEHNPVAAALRGAWQVHDILLELVDDLRKPPGSGTSS